MATLFRFDVLALIVSVAIAASKYKDGDEVLVYVNKVGPYYNPHETYHYYTLPVCRPDTIEHKSLTLGEVLDGDRMAKSLYKIRFKENVSKKELCKVTLNTEDISSFRLAIEDLYYFEFVIDDVPVRGFIGHFDEIRFPHVHKIGLWAHHHFNIEYNGDQIIYANVSTKEQSSVSLDTIPPPHEVAFSYSVKWIPTKTLYSERVKRQQDDHFFPSTLEIHWLSVINSLILVFLLIGFVIIILTRVLKSDFARYNVEDDTGDDLDSDDNGWKMIHADVFRFPPHRNVFCAILGVGSQFLALATGILLMALLGIFNVHRHGAINTVAFVLYAFTSCISGYVACNMYTKMGGTNWVWNINITSALFALPFFVVWAIINTLGLIYGTTQALPLTTILLLGALWLFVGFPLTVIGGIIGKNWANGFDAPCRTKNIAREIPRQPMYRWAVSHCIIGGFLPFSAISVELYYIFATLWGRESYTLYGILFLVYAILLCVTSSISVALTYFQLSSEDYRWWWRSVFSAGTTGIFIFLYALFYFFKRSHMSGLLQTAEFFGYTFLICYVFFLMLGTVSFFTSLKFVRYIYVSIKMD